MSVSVLTVFAQRYTVHSSTKGIYVESGGKKSPVTPGMSLKASDMLCIPEKGVVEILNSIDNRIYRSVRSGHISVTKLLVEARHSASDKLGTMADHMRFGRSQSSSGKRVYQEKGMVNRSLEVYDPNGVGVEVDPSTLGQIVASRILAASQDELPVGLDISGSSSSETEGVTLCVANSNEYPIYFNVFSVYKDYPKVEISPLGQPGGTYVLRKSQTISRMQTESLPDGVHTVIVVTPCQFELDEVIDEINKNLSDPQPTAAQKHELPIYIRNL